MSRELRVVHCIDTGGAGGAETVYLRCATDFLKGIQHPLAIVSREGWLSGELRRSGVSPVIATGHHGFDVSYLRRIASEAAKHQASLFHSHLLGSNVYCAIAAAFLRIPLVAVFHGPSDIEPRKSGHSKLKKVLLSRRRIEIVAVSRAVRDALENWGIPGARIKCVPNGIDIARFARDIDRDDARRCLGLPTDGFLIGCVGNIRRPKNYPLMMHAFARVLAARQDAHLVIAGGGAESDFAPLKALIAQLGLGDRVRLLGFVPDVPFRVFDVLASSSSSEGMPLSFLEAMASRVPVVATPTAGAEELISDGVTGFLAGDFTSEGLARTLVVAAHDTDLRLRVGHAAHHFVVKNFSLERMYSAYEDIYSHLLGPCGAPVE